MTNHASADPAAVLWDMDGTLVDTEPYWIRAETELMNAHGLPWSEEQGLEFVGNELIVSARMMREAGLDLPAEKIVETLMGNVIAQIRQSVPFRPGALELLAELKDEGIPSVMVTMSYRPLAEAVIASCPPESFAGLVSGDEVSAGKPDPEPYLRGAALLDLDPADCVALEDSKPGLASAEAAGTIAIGIPHFVDLEPRPGRILWDSLEGRGVAESRAPASRLVADYDRFVQSGEINFTVADPDAVLADFAAHAGEFPENTVDDLDGIGLQGADWWVNLRKSNTEPLVRLNVEAADSAQVDALTRQVTDFLNARA